MHAPEPYTVPAAAMLIAFGLHHSRMLGATVTVTVLDAGHELAPAISQLVGMLPRWVPIAVIGVVLLGVGATYEARLRDLSTLRKALAKLR